MPLFMDVHEKIDNLTADAVAGAHRRDLEVQEAHGLVADSITEVQEGA